MKRRMIMETAGLVCHDLSKDGRVRALVGCQLDLEL